MDVKNIATDLYVTIMASKKDTKTDRKYLRLRKNILTDLNLPYTKPQGDNFWLFYEVYVFPKDKYDELTVIADKYNPKNSYIRIIDIDYLEKYKYYGDIVLEKSARVSDPCYNMDTWCAGTIDNILPGNYKCYFQYANSEKRIASIKAIHSDHNTPDINISDLEDIVVGVDSGRCGIYDNKYFSDNCETDKWYDEIPAQSRCIIDGRAFISDSGYGDGSYRCYTAKNKNGKIIAIRIEYIGLNDIS